MDKSSLIDSALARLMDDMDGLEGDSAMKHSMDECPDPLTCTQHDSEIGESLTPNPKPEDGKPMVAIEIHKPADLAPGDLEGKESMESDGKDGESLSPEDAEILKKLLK